LAALYYRQAAYEEQLRVIDATLTEHEAALTEHSEQIGELHGRVESLEAGQRLLPEILERLGPQTLTPKHQAAVKRLAGQLHDLTALSYATIYSDLNAAFHVGKYSDIPETEWATVATWFQRRIDTAARGYGR
jgi:hypothetical protein